MIKLNKIIVMALCIGLLFASGATARRNFTGQRCTAIPCATVLSGQELAINGTIVGVSGGQGITVNDGQETITVYGLGPVWYWSNLEADRPTIGDNVEIDASVVTLSDGSERIIIMSIEVDGISVQLRNLETGCPLWF